MVKTCMFSTEQLRSVNVNVSLRFPTDPFLDHSVSPSFAISPVRCSRKKKEILTVSDQEKAWHWARHDDEKTEITWVKLLIYMPSHVYEHASAVKSPEFRSSRVY